MGTRWRLAILSFFVGALAMQALQHGSRPQQGDKFALNPEWVELNAIIEKMYGAMALVQPSGKSDVDFVKLMLPHHQAAIEMAKTQLLFGNDPQMQRLAQEIVTDQQSEIELMQLWLKQHEPQK
jgi:uncharacterized protein (DUF305 family)